MTNMDPVMEPIFTKEDTLSWSRNPENDTLFSGTSRTERYIRVPPPPGLLKRSKFIAVRTVKANLHAVKSLQRTGKLLLSDKISL